MRYVAHVAALTCIAAFTFLACGEQSVQGPRQTVASVAVTPASDTLVSLDETVQLTATARDANGATVAGVSFTWSSSDEGCAAVNSSGLVTASENGSVTITASTAGVSGAASITIVQTPASVAVAPASASLTAVGETAQLAATALDANGHAVVGTAFIWESSDDGVATVDDSGLVTAVADGTATINASTNGVATPGTADITVAQQPDSVAVSPIGAAISGVGTTQQFTVEVWDAGGSPIADPSVTWTSLNPNVATIDPSTGEAEAVESGQVTIAATANGATGYALLTVAVPGAEPVNLWTEMWNGSSNERALGIWGTLATDVYVVGDFSAVHHYDGASWKPMGGTFGGAIWGTSATDVYLMGWNGTILHYDGASWSSMESGTGSTLNSVWGASPRDIYAVGDAGAIVRYNGFSWSDMASGTFEDLNSVWGTSATNVYAVGSSGTILHYDGTSWSAMATGTSADFTGVWGTSTTDIYVVGQWPDRILHYEGATWSTVPGVTIHRPAAVWGSSATDIYVMGFAGAMLFYDGASWSEMETGTGNDLNAVWGTSAADVYVVGSPSLILRGVRGASVSVTPSDHTLTVVGETIQVVAEARNASNDAISGVTFAWKSSDLSIATVDATGLVTAVTNGAAAITATAPGGAADTAFITVTLSQLPPVAVIDRPGQDTTLTLGESIDFQGTASDVDGTIVGHSWDFGDGNGSTAEDPGTYTYAGVGSYTVTYQVTDDDGAKSPAASVVVTVVAALDPIEPGVWHGTTGAGFTFDFTIAAGADQITQIQYFWSGLSCEGVTLVSGSTTVSRTPGWSISGRQFTVDPDDEPTITGTFDDTGTAASGSWQWLSCSGTWTATP